MNIYVCSYICTALRVIKTVLKKSGETSKEGIKKKEKEFDSQYDRISLASNYLHINGTNTLTHTHVRTVMGLWHSILE